MKLVAKHIVLLLSNMSKTALTGRIQIGSISVNVQYGAKYL